jgi:hypothetical protein
MLWACAWLLSCLWAQLKTYVKRPMHTTYECPATLPRVPPFFGRVADSIAPSCSDPDHQALTLTLTL